MTTSRIGRGAVVTLGAVASLAWAASAANACDTPPKNPTPNTHDHGHGKSKPPATKPDTVCTVDESDVQYAPLSLDGKTIVGTWQDATPGHFQRTQDEPSYGYQVRLNPQLDENCTGTVDLSLASYQTSGPKWETSGGPQTFVDYAHVKLSEGSSTTVSQRLTVKLPGTTVDQKTGCFGQIDLYFGTKIYDGVHNPVPDYNDNVSVPSSQELITAWNGGSGACVATPPTTTTTTTTTTTQTTPTPPVQPTTHPSTPVATKPPAAKPSTPATPPTTSSPATPTLAHTGANVGEVSLVALAFFGAGSTAMFASRKAKKAGARTH